MAATINHLRCPGSSLYNISSHRHLACTETKQNPKPIPKNAVVESFGWGKCPRLVSLLNEQDESVLIHTLKSLGEVLKDPKDTVSCFDPKNHILDQLSKLVFHDNLLIQQLSAAAIHVISSHANGRTEILVQRTMRKILRVYARNDDTLIRNLLDAALNVSTTLSGVQEMTQNSYIAIILDKLKQEGTSDEVILRTLQLLKAFVNDGMSGTVIRIVESGGVEIVSKYIFSKKKTIQVAALQLIGAMMYLDHGRQHAMDLGLVKKLCKVLMDKDTPVCQATAGALMVLTIHDDAKREFHDGGCIPNILQLLYRQQFGIQLNVLKLVASIASYPPARLLMRTPQMEKIMLTLSEDSNDVLARAAKTAIQAVLWMP